MEPNWPTLWDRLRMRAQYYWPRVGDAWRYVTGRCPKCLQRHGNHKMDCSRNR